MSEVLSETEIQIPAALQVGGTFMVCFNLNTSIAESEDLTARVCHSPVHQLLGSPC